MAMPLSRSYRKSSLYHNRKFPNVVYQRGKRKNHDPIKKNSLIFPAPQVDPTRNIPTAACSPQKSEGLEHLTWNGWLGIFKQEIIEYEQRRQPGLSAAQSRHTGPSPSIFSGSCPSPRVSFSAYSVLYIHPPAPQAERSGCSSDYIPVFPGSLPKRTPFLVFFPSLNPMEIYEPSYPVGTKSPGCRS